MTRPITPSEAEVGCHIPDFVFEIVNIMITKNLHGGIASILQEDIVQAIAANGCYRRQEIFENRWLNFEEAYARAGWDVTYDKPAYNETYGATFTFKKAS